MPPIKRDGKISVRFLAGPAVQICNECVELCSGIIADESERKAAVSLHKQERLCGICMEARDPDELIFLPHAAYMCPGCLEELQIVRERDNDK